MRLLEVNRCVAHNWNDKKMGGEEAEGEKKKREKEEKKKRNGRRRCPPPTDSALVARGTWRGDGTAPTPWRQSLRKKEKKKNEKKKNEKKKENGGKRQKGQEEPAVRSFRSTPSNFIYAAIIFPHVPRPALRCAYK